MTARRWLVRIGLAIALVLAAVAVIAVRCVVQGEHELAASDAAFHRGDVRTSMVHARRAAVLYLPGAPHVRTAYQRLEAIAVGSEAKGDHEVARLAWRAVRGAALETRHATIVEGEALARANHHLARLAAAGSAGRRHGVGAGRAPTKRVERATAALRRDDAPRAGWVIAFLLGIALAALGLTAASLRGLRADGALALRRAVPGLVIALVGAACWTLAVWQA